MAGARPEVIPGPFDHAGFERIAFDVATATEQIRAVLDRRSLEPALPKMSDKTITPMIIMHIRTKQPGHESRQVARVQRANHQVEMISHQTVVMKPKLESTLGLVESGEKSAAIVVIAKHRVAVVAAIDE